MSRRLAALAAAAITTAAVAVPALAQGGGAGTTLTFSELDRGSAFRFVDLAPRTKLVDGDPKRISMGDELVFHNPLADAKGAPVGELRVVCIATHAARTSEKAGFSCTGDFLFRDGSTLAAQVGALGSGAVVTGAIVGGTGRYAGARGSFTSTDRPTGGADVVTLLP